MPDNPQVIMDSLRRIVQALRQSSAQSERSAGLSGAQALVLKHVAARDGLSINDLAGLTFTHQSSVSDVVSRLEARGLLQRQRDPDDARRCLLLLLPAGRVALAGISGATAQEKLMLALGDLPAPLVADLARGLAALVTAASLGEGPPVMFFESQPERPAT